MPPKPKFVKEEIVAAALQIVSQKGIEGLTARELAGKLSSSARPIFTVFSGMEALQVEVRKAAMARFENMPIGNADDMPTFKQVGMKMLLFAAQEPNLYRFLFMQGGAALTFEDFFDRLGESAAQCIETVKRDYGLNAAEAKTLFENVWIYTFGLGALCATGAFPFSAKELSTRLTTEFEAVMSLIKSNQNKGE